MSNWRYIAQRATTGEFLDMDVPLNREDLTWALSGAGSLRGTVAPDTGALRADDGRLVLEEWGTLLFAEADGEIRWGGIVVSSKFNGAKWEVEAAGYATYPHGLPFTDDYSKIAVDPAQIVRDIWSHLQSYPSGDLGVTVTGSTPVRLGTAPSTSTFTTGAGENVTINSGPYALSWWEAPDCGKEIESLAKETPFDFAERHSWDGDEIKHEMLIGYPRLGRRRKDLAFVQGDNISAVVAPTLDGDDYANGVLGLGAGEGKGSLQRTVAVRDGRLRRLAVYTAKDVTAASRMDSLIQRELRRRQDTLQITEVTVRDHPNAPIASWNLGDDVLIQATLPWLGDVDLWCRITGWSLKTEDTATLSLVRSDSFTYGG